MSNKHRSMRLQARGGNMKYTTVKISEIAAHPTRRLDPGYWIKKQGRKPQARKRTRHLTMKREYGIK